MSEVSGVSEGGLVDNRAELAAQLEKTLATQLGQVRRGGYGWL
jgi:hypothetical protein